MGISMSMFRGCTAEVVEPGVFRRAALFLTAEMERRRKTVKDEPGHCC